MDEGPRDTRHHPREEFAHDIHELGEDLAFERETLDESIKHDYSTSRRPGSFRSTRRRPLWHFAGLWLTFFSGFSFLFLGFEIYDGGHSRSRQRSRSR